MTYTTLDEANITTLAGVLTYVAGELPIFVPLLLLSLFFIVMLGSYFTTIRMRGISDFWGSFAIAGYFTAIVSIIMTLIPNLINTPTVVICIAVAVIGTGILFSKSE